METFKLKYTNSETGRTRYYAGSGRWTPVGKAWSHIGHLKNALTNWQSSYRWETGQPSLLEMKAVRLSVHGIDELWVTDLLEGLSFPTIPSAPYQPLYAKQETRPRVVFSFGSVALKEAFIGWMSDGGGEQEANECIGPVAFVYNADNSLITVEALPNED